MDSAAPEGRLNKPSDMQITFRYRVKDKHAALLAKQAAAVNHVWNFCNETQIKAVSRVASG